MWINTLTTYSLEFAYPETWAEKLAEHPISNPAIGQRKVIGFLPAAPNGGFVDRVEGHYAVLAAIATRHLPKDAVDREVRQQGRAAKDEGEAKAAWAEVEQQLLANAPIREKSVPAIYDADSKRLYVFDSSSTAENVVLAGLRDALGSLLAVPVAAKEEVQSKLTQWLREGKAPTPFLLGRMAELEAESEEGGKTVFKGQDLSGAIIQQHLDQGDFVSTLQLNWRGQLEFTLNSRGEIKKIAPPDCKMQAQHAFNMWPDIMDKLPHFFDDVMTLMGGVRELGGEIEVEERQRKVADGDVAVAPASAEDPDTATAEPTGRAVRVAIVAVGSEGDIPAVRLGLQSLLARRRISEIVLPDIGNPVMRMAYAWFKDQKLPIRLVHKDTGTDEDRMHKVFGHTPAGIVAFGRSDEVRDYVRTARNRGIGVMRLDASSNLPPQDGG